MPGQPSNHAATAINTTGSCAFSSRLDLPAAWELLDRPPSPGLREAAEAANASVLAFLLQGVDMEAAPRSNNEGLLEALAPIRTKLDFVLDMLTRLLYRDVELPQRCHLELAESRIAWQSPRPLQVGAWVRINIYFHSTFREPITLFGRVTGVAETVHGETYRVVAELIEMPERILADLGRLALLVQRRQWLPAASAKRGE